MELNRVLWTVMLYAAFFLNTTANNNGFDAIYAVLDGWCVRWVNIQTAIIHLVSYQQTRGCISSRKNISVVQHISIKRHILIVKKKTTNNRNGDFFDFGSPVSMFFTLSEAADFGKTRVGSQETSKLNLSRRWAECASVMAEKKKRKFF